MLARAREIGEAQLAQLRQRVVRVVELLVPARTEQRPLKLLAPQIPDPLLAIEAGQAAAHRPVARIDPMDLDQERVGRAIAPAQLLFAPARPLLRRSCRAR